ncbi:MAG: secretin N-terminal domain-containing protein [bacterium]
MRNYIRLFLAVLLGMLICSCAANRGKSYTALEDPLIASRKDLYKVKVEKMGGGGRRRREPPKESKGSDEESAGVTGKEQADEAKPAVKVITNKKDEETHTLFKPYVPQDEPQSHAEPFIDEMPAEIQEQILASGKMAADEYVTLNFEQAPIDEIINTISEALGLNYIMAPGVKGQITMQTSKPVPVGELFQILQSVLEVNGFTLVSSGRYFKVVQAKEAIRYPLEVMSGKTESELPEEETFVTQIIPLDYIPVKEMVKVLQPFLSKSAPHPIQHDELNLLILNDTCSNMKRLLKFVQELDKPLYQPKEKVFVYYVENGDAKELADTLNSIYKKRDVKKDQRKFPIVPQLPPGAQPGVPPAGPGGQPLLPPFLGTGDEVEGEVSIVAAEDINALIITTSPRNYPAVLETIKKLDIQPRQVLVEVLVAEITIDDVKEFGLDWSLRGTASDGVSYRIGQDLGGGINSINQSSISSINWNANFPGINYMLAKQDQFFALLNSKIEENKFNVLSSPHILATDNQEAKIEITDDYPIPRDNFDQNGNKTSTSYEYKSAGIILSFTPKINEKGLVSLQLLQEVSQGFPAIVNNLETFKFNTRKAETNVVVHSGETLIIGGLVKEQKSKVKNGIPFLMNIPLMGYLFSHTSDTVNKTELIILITPHVIKSEDESREITKKFQDRVRHLTNKARKGYQIGGVNLDREQEQDAVE